MRYIATLILAAATATIAHSSAAPDSEASAIASLLSRDPTAKAAFDNILVRTASLPAALDKRACGAYDPCCDSSGCRSRGTCYGSCGAISGTGGSGCVLGCLTACPETKEC